MPINVNKETINLTQLVIKDKYTIWENQDLLVPDTKPDVMKVLRVEGLPVIQDVELKEGSIRISGEITYYILYKSMDGAKPRGVSMAYPFVQTISNSNIKPDMIIDANVYIKNIIWSLPNERKISIKSEVVIDYIVNKIVPINLISKLESDNSVESLKAKSNYRNIIAVKQDTINISEEIMLAQDQAPIQEILRVGTEIKNTDYKVSYNKILVKGELMVQIVYLKNVDTSELGVYNTQVPFAGMIEFDNINDNSKFDINYRIQNMQLSLSGIDGNTISLTGEVYVRASMFENNQIEHIVDFYSTDEEYEYEAENVVVVTDRECMEHTLNLKESIGSLETDNKIVDYTVQTENLNFKVVGQNLNIVGTIKIPVAFVNVSSNIMDVKIYDLNVDTNISLGQEFNEETINIKHTVISANVSQSGSAIDANITIQIVACVDKVESILQLGDIIQSQTNNNNLENMYIYIIKKGDTLWSIAKKYKTTVAKIANTNNIVDENRINIGQKLLLIR